MGQKGVTGDEPVKGVGHLMPAQDLLDRGLQRLHRLFGRKAQVEARLELTRNDVGRAGAGVEI